MVAATVIIQAVILALRRHQWECFLFLQSLNAIIWQKQVNGVRKQWFNVVLKMFFHLLFCIPPLTFFSVCFILFRTFLLSDSSWKCNYATSTTSRCGLSLEHCLMWSGITHTSMYWLAALRFLPFSDMFLVSLYSTWNGIFVGH